MSKKKEDAMVPVNVETSLDALKPKEVQSGDDIQDLFNKYNVKNIMQLKKPGDFVEGSFLGKDEVTMWPSPGGGEPQPLNTWGFKVNGIGVRLLGSSVVDRELEQIEATHELPVNVVVLRGDKIDIGSGKMLTDYKIGVDQNAKKRTDLEDIPI